MAGPLEGLKILDFSTLLPGPYATMTLSDLGADVLRVTSGTRPDIATFLPPFVMGKKLNAFTAHLSRNKKSITLDFKNPKALKIIHQLVQKYDIVIEQFRPGVMAKLNLDYESLKKINPAIIYCSLSGYGQTGPLRNRAGHDINYLALSGVMGSSGRKKTGPTLTSMQISDVAVGSNNAIIGILSAAFSRERTGKGEYIDISMLDGTLAFNVLASHSYLAGGQDIGPEEVWYTGSSLYDFYKTKDGKYLSVGSIEPNFFSVFCTTIGRPELSRVGYDSERNDELKPEIAEIIASKTRDEWTEIFSQVDACVEPVLTFSEAINSQNAKDRGMILELELPNGDKVRQLANPIKFSENPAEYKWPGCVAGTHNKEVMMEIGYGEDEIEQFQQEGVFN